MNRLLKLLLLFFLSNHCLLKSEEDCDISSADFFLSAECEPTSTIAGCVNLSSGQFFQVNEDLKGNTIDPLSITKFYDSGNLAESFIGTGFGSQFPMYASSLQKGNKYSHAMISERDGFLVPFKGSSNHSGYSCRIDPRVLEKGYTNLSRAGFSGQANFVNRKAVFSNQSKKESWTISLGDGSKRTYANPVKLEYIPKLQIQFPTKKLFLLTNETKANGNKVKYQYIWVDDKPFLSKVSTLSRNGNAVINEINLEYDRFHCYVKSSCGKTVRYKTELESCYYECAEFTFDMRILKKVSSSQNGTVNYKSMQMHDHNIPFVARIEKPCGGYLQLKYNSDKRVKKLIEPRGPEGKEVTSYSFEYEKGKTKVWDAQGNLTLYNFDYYNRLHSVEKFDGKNIVRKQVYHWSNDPAQQGWLKNKLIRLNDNTFFQTSYAYDQRGNIICEKRYGNLTGEKADSFKNKKDTDRYSIQYQYSNDTRNLMISKSTPEGLEILYSYLPGTNLKTQELHFYDGNIQERTFYFYDDNGELQQIIEDDGSHKEYSNLTGVTYRNVKQITSETAQGTPSFGKPKQLMESFLDNSTNQMIVSKIINYSYDNKGNEIGQRVHNSDNSLFYTTGKAYDKRGLVTYEQNGLGQTTRYAYDKNNNVIEKELMGSGLRTQYSYDKVQRLIKVEDLLENGESYSNQFSYNALNQLISEVDYYENETNYSYDRLGRQILCSKPLGKGIDGELFRPTIKKKYNTLDQVIEQTDENGFTTLFTYNVYGKPTKIIHPDGAVERNTYYKCGWLKQKWQADGVSVHYQYNAKGHVTLETTYDTSGAKLKEIQFVYKGALLQRQIDEMGVITSYRYDGAGRKVEEGIGDLKKILYSYDDFGRQSSMEQLDRCEVYTYDALDRMVSKTTMSTEGTLSSKELYEYDIQGNKTTISQYHNETNIAHYRSGYNPRSEVIWKEDPFGNRKTWGYDNHFVNELGQQVRVSLIQDELGRLRKETEDAYGRIVKREKFDEGKLISTSNLSYDATGNLVKQSDVVMDSGAILREYGFIRKFNSRGWLISEQEIPDGALTAFEYDSMGRLKQKTNPNGVTLNHTYDSLGRLATKSASDHTLSYVYHYDLHDNPIEINDLVHNTTQKRYYDALSRMTEEEFSGMSVKFDYDELDRIEQMTLPDGSSVRYRYDQCHLKKAERLNSSGELKYTYECLDYDLKGKLLKARSPAGELSFTYDLLERLTDTEAPNWEEHLRSFDPVGNLLELSRLNQNGFSDSQYRYDSLNQLVSENSNGNSIEKNEYEYDSIGNCLTKNEQPREVDPFNRILNDGTFYYSYDINGNLTSQNGSEFETGYRYDGMNRLIQRTQNGSQIALMYDSSGLCRKISNSESSQQLIYQQDCDIGSMQEGKLKEFRLVDPVNTERVFAIEVDNETFFPIQDYRNNICALQNKDGKIVQSYQYSAFKKEAVEASIEKLISNPWTYANRRELAELSLFTHRFYNSNPMRWQTQDPLRFEDGMNLFSYAHNNPFCYRDPDGRFAILIAIPIVEFGIGLVSILPSAATLMQAVAAAAIVTTGSVIYNNMSDQDVEGTAVIDGIEVPQPNSNGKRHGEHYVPEDLDEQLALEEAKGEYGRRDRIMEDKINDPRYPQDKWGKYQHRHRSLDGTRTINIHYWEELATEQRHGYKFKDK